MALSAGSVASAADVLALVATDSPTTFTTTTPAGSGWYRYLLGGALVEFHWISTGTVSATTSVTPDFTIPAGYRPAARTAIAGVAGASSPRLADVALDSDGTWQVYNGHSSATVINAHGIYKPA